MNRKINFSYLFYQIKTFLLYPRRIFLQYKAYNGGIGEMIFQLSKKMQNIRYLKAHRARNSKLINIYILLPIFLGLVFSVFFVYQKRDNFDNYLVYLSKPIGETKYRSGGIRNYTKFYREKAIYAVNKSPLSKEAFYPFLMGYLACFLGAFILSKNPSFKKEEEIKKILQVLKHVDIEGRPWKVLWTPEAIMIETFGKDPYEFCVSKQGKNFWNAINFKPSEPIIFNNNINKFVVQRRYELPSELIFESNGEL